MFSVLVTGGAGYIGSHVCKALKRKGYNPVVLDNLSNGSKRLVLYGDFVLGNVSDYNLISKIIKKYNIKVVMHFAALKSVVESIKNPYEYFLNNVSATNTLLKAIIDCNIKHFIFSSSAAIFGTNNKKEKIKENDDKNPTSPYGLYKLMLENILDNYNNAYGINFTSLRYFNVIGSDPELEIGDLSNKSTNILNCLFKSIRNRSVFKIYGDDYDTPDGSCIRDYVHVSDLADAHVFAMEKQINNNKSIKINLGNGNGFSVKDVISATKNIIGIDFDVIISDRRPGDPAKLVCDSSLAKTYLNWQPKYFTLEKQILDSWKWYKLEMLDDSFIC